MNYTEIELWIKQNILKNCFSLNFLCENDRIFNQNFEGNQFEIEELNKILNTIGKKIKKTKINNLNWFKINFIDNAFPDLVGIGKISEFNDVNIFSSLLILDKAEQNGDSTICLFDDTKKWIIKINLCRDDNRITIRTYGNGKIVELLKNK